MTISSEVRTAGPFTGNGVATGGPFSFKVFSAIQPTTGNPSLAGVETDLSGADRTLVYGVDFDVTLNADQNASPGGTINYLIGGVGPSLIPTGFVLNFTSDLDNLQPVALTNAGGFFPRVINDALDRLTILVQQLVRGVNASLKFPLSDGTGISSELPNKAARLGKVQAYDAVTGAPVMSNLTLAQIEAGSTSAAASAVLASQWASLTTGIVAATDYSAKAWAIGGTGVTATATRGPAKDWATLTTGAVDTAEYSAKAYALGGTGVTNTAGKGAAKEWATTTGGTVDTSEYSAKEYATGTTVTTGSAKDWASKTNGQVVATEFSAKAWAIGGTNVTGTAARGASKEWATLTTGAVDTADYSAKAWAVGGTGVTNTATRGAAKEWATKTGGTVDTSEFSAKEYATGTSVTTGSAKDWATKVNGIINATDVSAKAWAIGGTGITDGAAKNWAQQTGADVTGAAALSRSAKSWAQDNLAGATYGGSAKDWAQSASLPDGTNKSAKSYATDAANSAAAINFRYCGTATGTANALVLTPGSALASYTGALIEFIIASANTTEAMTANVSTLGAKSIIVNLNGTDRNPAIGMFQPGMHVIAQYDGTNLKVLNAPWDNQASDVAAAATVALASATGNFANLTGTGGPVTAITGLTKGRRMLLRHTGIHQLTHSATLFLLNNAGNITTAVGDISEWVTDGTNVYMTRYHRADGTPLQGGSLNAVASKTTTYSIANSDSEILCNASGGAFTVTLPTAVGITGKRFMIKKTDSSLNAVTVATTSSQTIDGATTRLLMFQYADIVVESDGANWFIYSAVVNSAWTAYTPSFQGFGTPTAVNMFWKIEGDTLRIQGKFTTGTCTAVEARVGLPGSFQSNASGSGFELAGMAVQAGSGSLNTAIISPSNTIMRFGRATGGSGLGAVNGNVFFDTTELSFNAVIRL